MRVHELISKLQELIETGKIDAEAGVFFLEDCTGDGNVVFANEIIVDEDGDIVLGSDEI